ncbi:MULTISPECIES: AMP-binding protein [unclassified Herbaspirillum]|uniref:AMP-binding protein n=1 Tax=unclassified Herbaspirillum TaxID=2624150 RepID=UPI000E2E49E4|nr:MULTISPECIES: AMP-binding protein [unclassified Herbaspirillum]RFB70067.1 AMP-binding protein [Herbaspirillum sp. 3R-3a1]TFI06950.1 AMP-binding protein [Herbaspirillum sp. 3R11]TFI12888.1 AMP-binding protein [Herbaspirillum sp. 3R-11]TFI27791.1 AMP-binding protein [Herbaspirillum sp. 3C11]TFI27820.1 AMP-binding protein [Herbaspirillum sp. 3C11]
MPDFIDVTALPPAARADSDVIGWRGDDAVTHTRFTLETEGWRQQLLRHPGTRFALYLQDTIAFAAALFGAWQAGKTIYLPSDTLAETCKALTLEVDGFIGDFDAALQPLQPLPAVDKAQSPQRLDADAPALVVYTSGSTGTAQAIPKKLSQLSTEVATLEALFGARAGSADIVSTVSHQHIYGLLFKVLWPLAAGRAIHARSAFFPEDLAAIVPQRPWLLLSSPAHLKRLPDSPVQPDVSRLQAIFSSGGPLLPDVAVATRQLLGHRPIEIYGSSETGGIAWRQPQELAGAARDDSWQPMPRVEVRLNSEHDCLEVRSPHLPDDQWLRMADRVEFSSGQKPAQNFYLRGRADRIVKLEEKRISLDQIERLLLTSPLAAEARVLVHQEPSSLSSSSSSLSLSSRRERIAAFVVPTAAGRAVLEQQGKLALNTQLRTVLAGAIESVALPRLWRYLDALPANTQGKTTVAALTALLEQASAPISKKRPLWPEQTVLQRDDRSVTLQLRVPPDLLYFDGHFPATPILPGVVQVDWALALGQQYFDLPAHFRTLQALKFQRVVTPGATLTLELENDTQKNALAFRLHSANGQHASGRILFGEAA